VNPDPPRHRPDWYPDPTGRFEFRYHNGQGWTGDVSVNGDRFLDQLQPASVHGAGAAVPVTADRGVAWVPIRPESIAKSMAAFVLGVCSILVGWVPFLCVLAGAGAIVGFVLGIGALRHDRRARESGCQNHRGHGYALAGVALAPFGLAVVGLGVWFTVVTLREVDEFTNVGANHTTISSCTVKSGLATAVGTIANDSASKHSYHLNVDFDRSGTSVRVSSGEVAVDNVGAGQTAEWTVTEFVNVGSTTVETVDCVVRLVTGPVPFGQS
jgi:Protein of unknown function (DUF2510)